MFLIYVPKLLIKVFFVWNVNGLGECVNVNVKEIFAFGAEHIISYFLRYSELNAIVQV